MKKYKCVKNRSFTLIELLIVVAIIGILMSLLLPSLTKAKRSAKWAACFSNLATYHKATHMFLYDNGNQFPGHINSADAHQGRSWIGKKGNNYQWPLEVTQRPFNKYIGLTQDGMEAPQMKCPFNDDDVDVYHKVGSSYVGNEYNSWNGLGEKFLATINSPSQVVLSTEFGTIGFLLNLNSDYWRQTHFKGESRYPFLKIDGTVKHYKVYTGQGIDAASKDLIFNLNFD